MRMVMTRIVLAGLILVPVAASAGVALAPIMRGWNQDRRQAEAMLAGDRLFDRAALDGALQRYVADATMISTRVTGQSAKARDFAARFQRFAQDAAALSHETGGPARLRPPFARLMGECRACHAIYNQ